MIPLSVRRRWPVLFAALLVVSILGFLAFRAAAPGGDSKSGPSPDVCALVLFEDPQPPLLPATGPPAADREDGARYRRTQAMLLRTSPVLQDALKHEGVPSLAVVKRQTDPVAWLGRVLAADLLDDTGLLRVSVTEGSPEEKAALINAVVDAYRERVVYAEERRKMDRVALANAVLEEHKKELVRKRRNLRAYLEEHGMAHGAISGEVGQEDLAQMRRKLLRVRRVQVEKEMLRVQVALAGARTRLNSRKPDTAASGKAAAVKLVEEAAVLQEQEKLLVKDAYALDRALEKDLAQADSDEAVTLRNEIVLEEETVRRLTRQVNSLQVALRIEPCVSILQRAEARQ
jgi:hypothetical protein